MIKEFTLEQHSIFIHFQADPNNCTDVCLRASEVKPKLDRFLVKKIGGKAECKTQHKKWIRAEHPNDVDIALKYQMVITRNDGETYFYKSATRDNRNPPYKLPDIFYGNQNSVSEKYGVFFTGGLTLKIICFDSELFNYIDDNIAEFFAVTNFGTMQDKGFGSFTVEGTKDNYVVKALKTAYGAEKCYVISTSSSGFGSAAQNELFAIIKQVYSVMKSGQNIVGRDGNTIPDKYIRSFIYVYMHKMYIGNEKAFLKKKNVAPIRTTHDLGDTHENHQQKEFADDRFRYVRALLGIGGNIEWIEPKPEQRRDNPRLRKEKITISDVTENKKRIERLASPIFFKIIGSKIYMTANQPDERIFDRTFRFENTGYTNDDINRSCREGNAEKIETLKKEEGAVFEMADFLSKFKDYYNRNIKKLRNKNTIGEV